MIHWFSVETAERRHHRFHYMRVTAYNYWGERLCGWKFKSWK